MLHAVVLRGVDERIHADIEIGQKHCGVVADEQAVVGLCSVVHDHEIDGDQGPLS